MADILCSSKGRTSPPQRLTLGCSQHNYPAERHSASP